MMAYSRYEGTAALPTGESINPANPEGATYYDNQLVAFILQRVDEPRNRPTRVMTGYVSEGDQLHGYGEKWDLGKEVQLRHDQTFAQLGMYRIVGIINFRNGKREGLIPNRKIKQCVFK
jgi:hypothetical protein